MLTAILESFFAGNDYRSNYSTNNRSSVLGKLNEENDTLLDMVISNTVALVEEARNRGLNSDNPHET